MATVKIRFRASTVENKEGTLVYQVIHKRQTRQVSTGYKLYPQEWNMLYSTVDFPPKCTEGRRNYLAALQAKLIVDINMLKSIIVKLEHTGKDYRADDVLRLYRSPSETKGFVSFTESLIAELKRTGRQCTAERYATTLNSFKRFMAERNDIPLDLVESSLMVEYETFLKSNGICPNSISFYMRCLRAVYNRAVEKELVVQRNPFKHVYTGIDKTVKRAVPLKIIRQIRELDLTLTPELDYAKDLFLFSFYTRGMSFVDMAYLKKNDLKNGVLIYRRKKTGQQLCIRWERHMQDILEKYPMSQESPYLLPIILKAGEEERKQYNNALHLVNKKLKFISNSLQLTIPLTMYVARHSWATVAKSRNIPLSVISEGMGHDSENTTLIYLASLNTEIIDKANKLILNLL